MEQVLQKAGINTDVDLEVERDIWRKLVINSNVNALASICRVRTGTFLDQGEVTQSLFRDITSEIVNVANAKGIDLELEECLQFLNDLLNSIRVTYPSRLKT